MGWKMGGQEDRWKMEMDVGMGVMNVGHVYAIGDCGGANQESKCPECKARIGGLNHALVAGNQLAPEMDHAQHAAWSEMANMANFDPRHLQGLF